MYNKYDTFILTSGLNNNKIPEGTRGVVLMILDTSPNTYEVEFLDDNGENLGEELTYTLTENYMRRDNPSDSQSD